MKLHFKLSNTKEFSWSGLQGWSYLEKADFERASAARFKVTDRHGRVFNDISDRVYLVLDGSGWFDVAGDKFSVEKDDVIIVPRQTEYDYGGNMELFLVHAPAYDRSTDHDLENIQP
ncbi:MAG: hypothetical protein KBC33_03425 [Candidatus Pacebacteria bacterium]|nr:hypothetical protein [Candidatus Paceibacterota bacterium]